MSASETLFPLEPPSPSPEPVSATRRLTWRNRALLASGVHPATRRPLLATGETCGDCAHHHVYDNGHGRNYHKCDLHRLGESHSAASDIRVSWPACERFEAIR